ncbi:MAG: apolipoprotein N-acyltransferase [Acidimicrobiia bacterium]|nr:apolipoprotein N-acyltransferase [Acidimicrobiia bacterium]
MKAVFLVLVGAVVSVLAFPPFGPGILIVPGVALFLWGLRATGSHRQGLTLGAIYGVVFFGGLMWWLSVLDPLALILIPAQTAFLAAFGWWLARYRQLPSGTWFLLAVGGWGLMELLRYNFPFGGLEWGAAGYALSDLLATRLPAGVIGTSGLTILAVALSATAALAVERTWHPWLWLVPGAVALVYALAVVQQLPNLDGPAPDVAIVQGSTPCPFEHCPPNERLRTYQQHLALTQQIEPGSVQLVVWSESSTGATNADPVLNPGVGEAIGAEAERIGAWMLIGGDRQLSETHWVNANVLFDPSGEIVGEYRKQHPVPFGEYIPFRSVFGLIPALSAVPRDMVPGVGPVVFEGVAGVNLGSVISFEGGFSRYALEHRRAGANLIVIATNEASYDRTPASDQFIGMTRMRAVELGVPVVHAAVTGKSVVVQPDGSLGEHTGLGTMEILRDVAGTARRSIYTAIGDIVLYLAAATAVLLWLRSRALVGSEPAFQEEE